MLEPPTLPEYRDVPPTISSSSSGKRAGALDNQGTRACRLTGSPSPRTPGRGKGVHVTMDSLAARTTLLPPLRKGDNKGDKRNTPKHDPIQSNDWMQNLSIDTYPSIPTLRGVDLAPYFLGCHQELWEAMFKRDNNLDRTRLSRRKLVGISILGRCR